MATIRKKRLWVIGIVTAIASVVAVAAPHAGTNASVPSSWITQQVNFILSKQLPSGAIVGAENLVMPYFGNVGAIGLIAANTSASRAGALNWMKWYLANLNPASAQVPANSVFDYTYDPSTGSLTPTGDFDSVDSYASTTLNLAYSAFASGDTTLKSYVSSHISTYEAIANLLTYSAPAGVRLSSGASSGLTIAKPSYAEAYTMDNSEVFSGLLQFSQLETSLGRMSQSEYYASWASTTQSSILSKLWNPANNNWNSSYGQPSVSGVFYADGTAQVWPTLYGVVTPTSARAITAWAQFSHSFPDWFNTMPDNYAWTSIARVAQVMGDTAHASTYLTALHKRFSPSGTPPNICGVAPCAEWYDNEAGWFIVAGLSTKQI